MMQTGPAFDTKYCNLVTYQIALQQCMAGVELEERGQKYRTWDGAQLVFDPNYSMLFNFPDRKLNVRYAIEEFLWYIRANKYDDSIEKHASMWKKLQQEDGSYFSNYGQYIFSSFTPDGITPFRFAFEQLKRNAGSRRAAIPLLRRDHCFHENTDMVCTFAIQWFIRNNSLNMIVNMRSNDAVWGLTNDAFCFVGLHKLMLIALQNSDEYEYMNLRLGTYSHIANTLHVYERHYEMVKKIIDFDVREVKIINEPLIMPWDAEKMLHNDTEDLEWTKSFLASLPS